MKRGFWIFVMVASVVVFLVANCGVVERLLLSDAEKTATALYLDRLRGQEERAATETADAWNRQRTEEAKRRATEAAKAEEAQREREQRRLVVIRGNIHIKDDEIFDDEHCDFPISHQATLDLSRLPDYTLRYDDLCCGGEVRVELTLNLSLAQNMSVDVDGHAELYEGTSCATKDREDRGENSVSVPPDYRGSWNLDLLSRGAGGGDEGKITLDIENRAAP